MKKLTSRQRERELKVLASVPADRIDTSDIPELTEEQLSRALRGQMYRPIKKPVTMRLDADVIAWLKEDGRGYQTKANALLRQEMVRSHQKKAARSVAPHSRSAGKSSKRSAR